MKSIPLRAKEFSNLHLFFNKPVLFKEKKMCNKKCYDKIDAMFALSQCKHFGSAKRNEKRIYFCPICKKWHLTSKDKNRKV